MESVNISKDISEHNFVKPIISLFFNHKKSKINNDNAINL